MDTVQLEQEILDFSEGLRVVGVEPEEKFTLFADNSYRWLVTDQGCSLKYVFLIAKVNVFLLYLIIFSSPIPYV